MNSEDVHDKVNADVQHDVNETDHESVQDSASPKKPKGKKKKLFSDAKFFFTIGASLWFGVIYQPVDWFSDVVTIRLYVTSGHYKFAAILLTFLLFHCVASSFYSLRHLRLHGSSYGALWWRHRAVRLVVVLLHCVGLGSMALNFDLLVSRLRLRFGRRTATAAAAAAALEKLELKEKHCKGMSLIHTFTESFPQLLLQTIFMYIKETFETDTQCFPASLGSGSHEELRLWHIHNNGSVTMLEEECTCADSEISTTCKWRLPPVLVLSIVLSLSSLAFGVVRHGPLAFLKDESSKEVNSLAVVVSFWVKVSVYFFGVLSGILGSIAFIFIVMPWSFLTSPFFLLLMPFVLLQISQPNWLCFMFHRITKRPFEDSAVVNGRGAWWAFFLTLSPLTYVVVTLPISFLLMLKYAQECSSLDDIRPMIIFSDVNVTASPNCSFVLNGAIDQAKWRRAVEAVYPNCSEDTSMLPRMATNCTNEKLLELGNGELMAPGEPLHSSLRCGAILTSVVYSLLQMYIFRNTKTFDRNVVAWPILLGVLGVMSETILMYNQNFEESEITIIFLLAMLLYYLVAFSLLMTPFFLLCRRCCRCCCRCCCNML